MAIKSKEYTKEQLIDIMTSKSRICEMVSETTMVNVPVDHRIDIETITADDPDPKFVNVEVIRAGISGNRRRYGNNVVNEICQLIPGVQGFFGHPDPSKVGFEFREPQCIYVGAITEQLEDGAIRCIAKAYLFKTSPLREWVPKSIAAGNPMTVSINGSADVIRNTDTLDVIHMTELQSVDWANPSTEGMGTSKAISVVAEMNNNMKGDNEMSELNAQDIIKNATVSEFKAFNPTGYDAIVKGITVTELQAQNPDLVSAIIEANKVTEMQLTIGGKQETVKIAELQGKIDAYEQKITELEDAKVQAELDAYKVQKITEQVDEKHVDAFMKRVTGKTKEEIDASIQSEIAFVREMGGMNNAPVGRQHNNLGGDDIKDAVLGMFGVKKESK